MEDTAGFHVPRRQELSRREAQIMEILYRLGTASAADIHARIPEPPSYSTVRKQLEVLTEKGHVLHHTEGRRFLYQPVLPAGQAAASAARQLVSTFFRGSASQLMQALLKESDMKFSERELQDIARLADQARTEGR
jgi:BlaI family transcriptional regulator, penicillinase repressor